MADEPAFEAVVARVSGPRTVRRAESHCRVTTISQWLAAAEMNDSSGSLCVRHACSIRGERADRRSNVNTSTARFIPARTVPGSENNLDYRKQHWANLLSSHERNKERISDNQLLAWASTAVLAAAMASLA